jgi:hypothetical protein
VTGTTYSDDFPVSDIGTSLRGGADGFVAMVHTSGSSLVWSSYLGGGGSSEAGAGITVDAGGDVVVTGVTDSPDFPASGGFNTTLQGATDAFVARLDASGWGLVWSSYLGGRGSEVGAAVAHDSSGNIYLTGITDSTDFPVVGGFDTTPGGETDAYVAKIDPTGKGILWSSYLGGSALDEARGLALLGEEVYVVGRTASADFPTAQGLDDTLGGEMDAFAAGMPASGSGLSWSTYLGGSGDDEAFGIAVDRSGSVYVAGLTRSADLPTTAAFDSTLDGPFDAFVARFDPQGDGLAWSTYLGASGFEQVEAIAVDGDGNAYLTGSTQSTDFPTTTGLDRSIGGSGDAFVTRIGRCGDGTCDAAAGEDCASCSDCCEPTPDGGGADGGNTSGAADGCGCAVGARAGTPGSAPGVVIAVVVLGRRRMKTRARNRPSSRIEPAAWSVAAKPRSQGVQESERGVGIGSWPRAFPMETGIHRDDRRASGAPTRERDAHDSTWHLARTRRRKHQVAEAPRDNGVPLPVGARHGVRPMRGNDPGPGADCDADGSFQFRRRLVRRKPPSHVERGDQCVSR